MEEAGNYADPATAQLEAESIELLVYLPARRCVFR